MRVLLLEMEGDTATMQDALRTFGSAIQKPTVERVVVAPPPQRHLDWASQPQPAAPPADADIPTSQAAELADEQDAAEAEPDRRREAAPKRDRNVGLSLVKDLDLHPKGKPSLKAFMQDKRPQSAREYIVLFVYYLAVVLELPKFGMSHVFTAFNELGVRKPLNLPQALRTVAHKKAWIDSGDSENLKITTAGRNFVEHDLRERVSPSPEVE